MKLIIQKTSQPSSIISDSQINDIKELLLGYDTELQDEFDIEEDEEESDVDEEPGFGTEDETEFEEIKVSETEDDYTIEITAPDFQKEDFIIEVSDDGILSVNAMVEAESSQKSKSIQSTVITENSLSRSFRLPEDANIDDIEATYENDVLVISIAKN